MSFEEVSIEWSTGSRLSVCSYLDEAHVSRLAGKGHGPAVSAVVGTACDGHGHGDMM